MAQTDKQMALLKNRLQMPLFVRDLLITNLDMGSDENYALHEMLGNFSAEDALLCSTFVMQEIASHDTSISSEQSFLHMECERIIERYNTRDSISQENPNLWSETQNDMLSVIYEDMEELLELTELCQLSFDITNQKIAKILNIITTQLQSHMMILDEVISMISITKNIEETMPATTGMQADNVVMFPS